ncbi:CxC ATPase DNA modification system associated small protein [Trichocoleus sp. DQ-U1]|uniref:CxC ATPase DNA modification system associated small protein n=1 Tax=Trichocoleus sp. DQ-U1 TaxID=2933926 RepID=UPI00329913F1
MAIDIKVYEAVHSAVKNHNQPEKVAKRMMNWLEQLSDGTASLSSQDDIRVSLGTILDAIQSDEYEYEDEELE